jgi:Protein of unknown function (DUF4235)
MADKRGDIGSRAVGGLAAVAAGFATRKAMALAWKRITGKEPPEHPEDPEVRLGEAVSWAAMMGVAMSTARLLATRVATRRRRTAPADSADSKD